MEEALALIEPGREIPVDLGLRGESQHFVNVSAGGFIAEVSEAVNPTLKSFAGKLAYLIGGAQVLFEYQPVAAQIVITGEQGTEHRELDLQTFAVCNSRMIGGGRLIAPRALIDDGLLEVCIIEAMPMPEFIALLGRISIGEHLEDPHVSYLRAREVRLEFSRPIKVNTDGEVHEACACHYRVLPLAARFFAGDAPFTKKG